MKSWLSHLTSVKIGAKYEQLACEYLKQQGLQHKQSNYRCKMGEIDLVMLDGDTIVFVEVKYRKTAQFGHSAEMVSKAKLIRLAKTIKHYLQQHQLNEAISPVRFDVVTILASKENIHWLKNIELSDDR